MHKDYVSLFVYIFNLLHSILLLKKKLAMLIFDLQRAQVGSWWIVWHLLLWLSVKMGSIPTNQWLRSRYIQRKKPVTGSKHLWFLYRFWMNSAVLSSYFHSHSPSLPSFFWLNTQYESYFKIIVQCFTIFFI